MFKNNNKKIIRKIAKDKMKSNRGRYLMLLIAIVMTAVLLTGTLTVGASFIKSMEYTTMRQVGSKSHGGFKYLTPDIYEQIENHPDIKEKSSMQTIGFVLDPAFKTRSQQVFYMDQNAMDFSFMLPLLDGNLPVNDDEIVVNTLTLDMLNLPYEVGVEIQVDLDMDGEIKPVTWTVAGIYEGDHMAMADIWVVSKPLSNKMLEGIDIVYSPSEMKYAGLIQMGVMLNNSNNTEEKLLQIAEEEGISDIENRIAVNWAYTTNNINFSEISMYAVLLFLLIFSGYLTIYNIFYIGIIHDIQFYGMLKTIGCTKKQLKRIVIQQGIYFAIIGIPLGLAIGYLIGRMVSSYAIRGLNVSNVEISMNPLIFVFGVLLTLLTVYISARKPARMASKVSPIEASKMSVTKKKTTTKKKRKFSVFLMAKDNVMSYKKKALIVVLSMTISLVLLQTVTTSTSAVDMDQMINSIIAEDYTIANVQLFDYRYNYLQDTISGEILSTLESVEGMEVFEVYCMDKIIKPSNNLFDQVQISENTTDYDEIELLEGKQKVELYGIEEMSYKYLEEFVVEGEFDHEKFSSGTGVVISKTTPYFTSEEFGELEDIYNIGDTIAIPNQNGVEKNYDIIGFVDNMPYYLWDGSTSNLSINIYMSADEFEAINGVMPVMLASVKIDERIKEEAAVLLDGLAKAYPEFAYKSRNDYIEELSSFDDMLKLVGYSLSLLLGLVAILNFINTFVSNIVSRRRELAMLQSMGMTSRQLLIMLVMESALLSLISIVAGFVIGGGLSMEIANGVAFSTGEISFTPLIVVSPILILILSIVPIITYNNLKKESLVERLRVID